VLTNEDLNDLAKRVQVGLTPVIIADSIDWVPARAASPLRAELATQLERWRLDWESRNTDRYLQHYAPTFGSEQQGFAQWSAQKRRVNASKEWIKVGLSDVSMFLYPGRTDLAVIDFAQDYNSSNLSNKMRKRQYWIREKGSWKILYEGAG